MFSMAAASGLVRMSIYNLLGKYGLLTWLRRERESRLKMGVRLMPTADEKLNLKVELNWFDMRKKWLMYILEECRFDIPLASRNGGISKITLHSWIRLYRLTEWHARECFKLRVPRDKYLNREYIRMLLSESMKLRNAFAKVRADAKALVLFDEFISETTGE